MKSACAMSKIDSKFAAHKEKIIIMQQSMMSLAAVVETRSTVAMEPVAACRPFAVRHSLKREYCTIQQKDEAFPRP